MIIVDELFNLQDLGYKAFHSKLVPTLNPDTIIGVRTPHLKAFAKRLVKEGFADDFIKSPRHSYYEENNLHAFIISEIKNFDECIKCINEFLPYVDNWATCDGLRPKCFAKNKDRLLLHIKEWIKSERAYTVRFAIEMLMVHFLDNSFDVKYHEMVSCVQSEEYYVNMMIAWYFATSLCKQWENTVKILENSILSVWVHNKTIQKAVESYRITPEQKEYLAALRRKNNG